MKQIILSCVAALMSVGVWAADTLTVRQLFIEMPDTVVPYLTRNNRLDFIDFMDSNMKAEVTNLLGGKSRMTALTADSLSLQLNESCRMDLLLLRVQHSSDGLLQKPNDLPADTLQHVLCLVRTLKGDAGMEESSVVFYTTAWHRLDEKPALMSTDERRLKNRIRELDYVKEASKRLNKQ